MGSFDWLVPSLLPPPGARGAATPGSAARDERRGEAVVTEGARPAQKSRSGSAGPRRRRENARHPARARMAGPRCDPSARSWGDRALGPDLPRAAPRRPELHGLGDTSRRRATPGSGASPSPERRLPAGRARAAAPGASGTGCVSARSHGAPGLSAAGRFKRGFGKAGTGWAPFLGGCALVPQALPECVLGARRGGTTVSPVRTQRPGQALPGLRVSASDIIEADFE